MVRTGIAQRGSPDPDLAAVHGVVLTAGRQDSCGLDGGGVRAAGWFRQTEGGDVFTWKQTTRHPSFYRFSCWLIDPHTLTLVVPQKR